MRNLINVARYHLVDPWRTVATPWAVLAFVFVFNLVITIFQGGPNPTKALAAIYAVFAIFGVMSIVRRFPFGLALGVSRRSYYASTAVLALVLGALDGLVLAVLEEIERATGGWDVGMHFFQVGYLFVGPWYLTWLTSFVCLSFAFVWGMCVGAVSRRWDAPGLIVFAIVEGVLVFVGTRIGSVDHFFTHLSATGLTGVLAVSTLLLFAVGNAVMRRLSV